jgi:hypothetical protein
MTEVNKIIDKQRPREWGTSECFKTSLNYSDGLLSRCKADVWLCGFLRTGARHIRLFVRWARTLVEVWSACRISSLYRETGIYGTRCEAERRLVFIDNADSNFCVKKREQQNSYRAQTTSVEKFLWGLARSGRIWASVYIYISRPHSLPLPHHTQYQLNHISSAQTDVIIHLNPKRHIKVKVR